MLTILRCLWWTINLQVKASREVFLQYSFHLYSLCLIAFINIISHTGVIVWIHYLLPCDKIRRWQHILPHGSKELKKLKIHFLAQLSLINFNANLLTRSSPWQVIGDSTGRTIKYILSSVVCWEWGTNASRMDSRSFETQPRYCQVFNRALVWYI